MQFSSKVLEQLLCEVWLQPGLRLQVAHGLAEMTGHINTCTYPKEGCA